MPLLPKYLSTFGAKANQCSSHAENYAHFQAARCYSLGKKAGNIQLTVKTAENYLRYDRESLLTLLNIAGELYLSGDSMITWTEHFRAACLLAILFGQLRQLVAAKEGRSGLRT